MFDKFIQKWNEIEDKLPGFRYFTATFLVLIAAGFLVLNYVGKNYWWLTLPGILLILLLVLFVWLILTIVNPPPRPDPIVAWMRRFLVVFVLFLFVGFVITGLAL